MKPLIVMSILLSFALTARSQFIGWYGQDQGSGHMVTLNIGADFGTVYGLSYGYKFAGIPLVVGTELITPFGGKIMDDFKAKLTAETTYFPVRNVGVTVKPGMSVLRNGSDAGIILNISADLNTSVGYYRDSWSFAAEATYERSFATLFQHRSIRDDFPDVKDEWYKVKGGTFKFGLQGSYWLNTTGVGVKAGKVYGQNFSDNPTIPFYADFSIMKKL